MRRTLLAAAGLAALGVAPAHAAPVWTDTDTATIYAWESRPGEAACAATALDAALRYVHVDVAVVDQRGTDIELTVGCTVWAGSTVVAEVTTSGLGAAAASGNRAVALPPTHVCVWGTWMSLSMTFEGGGFGSRDC